MEVVDPESDLELEEEIALLEPTGSFTRELTEAEKAAMLNTTVIHVPDATQAYGYVEHEGRRRKVSTRSSSECSDSLLNSSPLN